MPNETNHLIEIKGEQADIDDFIATHKKPCLMEEDIGYDYWDFEASVPIDNELYSKYKALIKKEDYTEHCREDIINKIIEMRELQWGTKRAIVASWHDNKLRLETPWTPCDRWFKLMVLRYPTLNFVLTYNDEFSEEYYGWIVACKGEIIGEARLCLHINEEIGGIDLYSN